MQNLLDFDSLSAGVWYIAIDFQLFTLLLFILWLARAVGRGVDGTHLLGIALVAGLALLPCSTSTATRTGTTGRCISSARTHWARWLTG